MSAQKIVECARSLKGTKWRHRGRKPWAVDCVGLMAQSLRGAGIDFRDETHYGREPWDDQLRKGLRDRFGEVVNDWRPGDIALIRLHKGEPSHVGILTDHPDGGLSIIHVHNLHGVVEHSLNGRFLEWIVEVYRPWPR